MNILLYYPRLLTALVFAPKPHNHATLQHWANTNIFWYWNLPWRDGTDSIGMQVVRRFLKKGEPVDPSRRKSRLASCVMQYTFLALLFIWPFLSLLVALRAGRRWFTKWNELANNYMAFVTEPESYYQHDWKDPVASTTFLASLLHIYAETGIRIPDRKDETDEACRRFRIPTPRAYTQADIPLPDQQYIVKPVNGSSAKGIVFTAVPEPFLGNPKFLVNDIVRNPLALRRLWGTDTLATFRTYTVLNEDGDYEFIGALFKIPWGGSRFDNASFGNAYAAVDSQGILQRAYIYWGSQEGFSHHPITGERLEGVLIDGFGDCVDLARQTHRCLGPAMPFVNSDIAPTEQGPMLIEINRVPGQYAAMYRDGFSEKCVQAICRSIRMVHCDRERWLRLAARPAAESSPATNSGRNVVVSPQMKNAVAQNFVPAGAASERDALI